MAERAAFAPKERFSDPDQLGAIFVSDPVGDINVREAVAGDGDYGPKGYIVTDDPQVIRALDGYEPLKRVSLDDAEEAARPAKRKGTDKGDES
jgi:hypothetical protein